MCVVVVGDGVPADARELVDGGVEGHGAEDVGRAGLLSVGRVGPHHLVEVDEVDGAATGQERVAVGERGSRADEHAGAEGRVHLVPAPREEVGVGGQRAVGRELGGVDEDGDAPIVGGGDDGVERGIQPVTFEAPVMASRRGRGAVVERGDDVVDVEGARRAALDVAALASRAHGSRLAWCSTTVVTTTSSGSSWSR